ncbi:hypothetical protein [Faecalicoccus acidiformans]|uniref:Uncharacterized protein n=1 Tax=Faecalicoccus acidiformans TaxID=915173 RepID=A0ABS2FLS9_9FIRM|nr:hypothetical protein [Faecalicoccus acidiformans]MBM6830978.1 hypothetical protein [Faecalicoccus acidiformans]
MSIKKDYLQIEFKSTKLKYGVALIVIWAICVLLRLTPVIDNYWANYLTALVVSNTICIIVIAGLLIAINFIELQRYKELIDKEEQNVH